MADQRFDSPDQIRAIVQHSSRLRYLLTATYGVNLEALEAIRVDGDNIKIDVHPTEGPMLRFKAKGLQHVLRRDPDKGIMTMELDPALAQALYSIVDEFL